MEIRFEQQGEKVVKITTPDPLPDITEEIDLTGLNATIKNLDEQVSGFEAAKVQADSDYEAEVSAAASARDARKADMDGKIAAYKEQADKLTTAKQKVLEQLPDVAKILNDNLVPVEAAPVEEQTPAN